MCLLYTALSFSYIQVYPASQADSPSFRILYLIGGSGKEGLSPDQILLKLGEGNLFDSRIRDLEEAGWIKQEYRVLSITPKGRRLLFPFLWLRGALGLPLGKG